MVITVVADDSSGFTLAATGYKVRGLQKADLEWSGATSANVDVYRDGALIATTANDGFYTDNIDQRGGSYTYQVCEAGTSRAREGFSLISCFPVVSVRCKSRLIWV